MKTKPEIEVEKQLAFELDRHSLYLDILKLVNECASYLDSPDKIREVLRQKGAELCRRHDIFEIFNNVQGENIADYVKNNGPYENYKTLHVTLKDYLEQKAKYGIERMGIVDQYGDYHLALTSEDLKHLIRIFKKLAAYDEVNKEFKGGVSNV